MPITDREQFLTEVEGEFGIPQNIKRSNGISRPTAIDMENELAMIQALNRNTSTSGGIGRNIGGVVGTGVGAVTGTPAGAAVGGTVGGTIGSVVDYMIDSEAQKKAEQKRVDALRKAKVNQAHKNNSIAWMDKLAQSRGIAVSEFDRKMDRYNLARQMRNQFIQQLFGKIAATKARKQNVNQQFIQSRGLV